MAMYGVSGKPSFTRHYVHIARSGLSQSVHPGDEMYGRGILWSCLNCSFVRSLHRLIWEIGTDTPMRAVCQRVDALTGSQGQEPANIDLIDLVMDNCDFGDIVK